MQGVAQHVISWRQALTNETSPTTIYYHWQDCAFFHSQNFNLKFVRVRLQKQKICIILAFDSRKLTKTLRFIINLKHRLSNKTNLFPKYYNNNQLVTLPLDSGITLNNTDSFITVYTFSKIIFLFLFWSSTLHICSFQTPISLSECPVWRQFSNIFGQWHDSIR